MSDHALEFWLDAAQPSERLDKWLAGRLPQHSRARIQEWIASGHVHVNGQAVRIRHKVGGGDHVQVWEQASPESLAFVPQAMDLDILAAAPDWIVVAKPAGLVTHPGAGNWQGTLLNGLLHRFPELSRLARGGIVHRLDKDTSGALVVARSERAQTALVRQLQTHTVYREYRALVHGVPPRSGTIDQAVGRDRRVPVRMSVRDPVAPKPAVTHYEVLRQGMLENTQTGAAAGAVSELRCRLQTGRTHQIRVHLASLGHPLLGDTLYGGRAGALCTRQMLHARRLCFLTVPEGEERCFEAPWPADFQALQEAIAWNVSPAGAGWK